MQSLISDEIEHKSEDEEEDGHLSPSGSTEFNYYSHHHHFHSSYSLMMTNSFGGGPPLETLPEEEDDFLLDEEDKKTDESSCPDHESLSTSSPTDDLDSRSLTFETTREKYNSTISDEKNILGNRSDGSNPTIRTEMENLRARNRFLESKIQRLQDEVQEVKDQNELLEFRLLELGDLEDSQSSRVHLHQIVGDDDEGITTGNSCKSPSTKTIEEDEITQTSSSSSSSSSSLDPTSPTSPDVIQIYGSGPLPPSSSSSSSSSSPEEVTISEDNGSNGHPSVTEAQSSCSDCSESLSFQESGIFESQFSDESTSSSIGSLKWNIEDISQELGNLVNQIENLIGGLQSPLLLSSSISGDVLDFNGHCGRRRKGTHHRTKSIQSHSNDLTTDFLLYHQRLQDFQQKLSQLRNLDYVQNLESRISILLQRHEEERLELEEVENDRLNQCQRLEMRVKELEEKKDFLRRELWEKGRYIETCRLQLLQSQQQQQDFQLELNRLESKIQSHEQQNFELEESYIELKDSLQFLLGMIPVLLLWTIWSVIFQKSLQYLPLINKYTKRSVKSELLRKSNRFLCPKEVEKVKRNVRSGENKMMPSHNSTKSCVQFLEKTKTELDSRLDESILRLQDSEEKLKLLENSWEILITEFETLDIESKKSFLPISFPKVNSSELNTCPPFKPPLPPRRPKPNTTESNFKIFPSPPQIRQGTLVANRIRSLFPDQLPNYQIHPQLPLSTSSPLHKFQIQLSTLKESQILLKTEIKYLHELDTKNQILVDSQKQEIFHLCQETSRLTQLLNDQNEHDKMTTRLIQLETQNEELEFEINTGKQLKRRLEETQIQSVQMMNRLEEIEEAELKLKQMVIEAEKREKKLNENLIHLRSELEILRMKYCQVQDENEIQNKVVTQFQTEINYFKSEIKNIQAISQEKECDWKVLEESYTSQISKFQKELAETQEELGELECSDGMLREEILYFEKTLGEVREKAKETETLVQVLENKLEEKNEEIQKLGMEMDESSHGYSPLRIPSIPTTNHIQNNNTKNNKNDLNTFFGCTDGGLVGISRDLTQVIQVLNNCSVCKHIGNGKLNEVLDQFNILMTFMSQNPSNFHHYHHHHHRMNGSGVICPHIEGLIPPSLSPCESEEQIFPQMGPLSICSQTCPLACGGSAWSSSLLSKAPLSSSSSIHTFQMELERKDEEIQKLREKEDILNSQVQGLEEIRVRREKDLRESHLNESWWWKLRCTEKDELIQILAKGILQLSILGPIITNNKTNHTPEFEDESIVEKILKDIVRVQQTYPTNKTTIKGGAMLDEHNSPILDSHSLLHYFQLERRKIMDILEARVDTKLKSTTPELEEDMSSLHFRVLRRIGDDGLLVSWNPIFTIGDGYEICVNGESFLRIRNPQQSQAILFGLNLAEPLQLSLRRTSSTNHPPSESSITYIA